MKPRDWMIVLMAAGWLTAAAVYGDGAASGTASAPASRPAAAAPAGRFIKLETGTLFIPAIFTGEGEQLDLLVHFHGDPATVGRNVEAARLNVLVLIINYPGLSAAYAKPMREDSALFDKALAAALAQARREKIAGEKATWRTVCVSSFSAGFGAVRELLKQDRYFERIDALCMLDSIYAGYVGPSDSEVTAPSRSRLVRPARPVKPVRLVDPANMQGFRRFALAAAEGNKTFLLTHSYLVPGSYASTIETADDLISHIGATRHPFDERVAGTPVHIVSRVRKAKFEVWGCAGTDGDAHMQHLRHMHCWLGKLPFTLGDKP